MTATGTLQAQGEGRFLVTGELSFDTVNDLLAASRTAFAGVPQLEIDLSGVRQGDSAGLALLIEWLRLARKAGQQIRYTGMPQQLRALGRISDVEEMLPVAD